MDAIAAAPPTPVASATPEAPGPAAGQAFAAVLARVAAPGPAAGAQPAAATPGTAAPEPGATALPLPALPSGPSLAEEGGAPAASPSIAPALPPAHGSITGPVDPAPPEAATVPTPDTSTEDPQPEPDAGAGQGPSDNAPPPPAVPEPAATSPVIPSAAEPVPNGATTLHVPDQAGAAVAGLPPPPRQDDANEAASTRARPRAGAATDPPGAPVTPRNAATPLAGGEPVERPHAKGVRRGADAAPHAGTARTPEAAPLPRTGAEPGPSLIAARPPPEPQPPIAAGPSPILAPPQAERRASTPGADTAAASIATAAPDAARPAAGEPGAIAAAPPRSPPPASPARQVAPVVVAIAVGGGTARLSVTLEPAELGRVEISVEGTGAAAQVRILAERPETLALLQRDQAEIERSLTQSGMATEGRSLALGLAGQGAGSGFGRDRRGDGSGTGGRAARGTPSVAPPGIAETPQPRRVLSLLDLAI